MPRPLSNLCQRARAFHNWSSIIGNVSSIETTAIISASTNHLRKGNAITTEDTPKQLGDFEILRELGRGGMGVVYEARQKSLNRRVALKVLSTGLGLTTKAVMRFKREAEAAAKLHHTNIVPIYSTGDEGHIPYYAMELVDGPSLDQVIRQLRSGSEVEPNGSLDSTRDASPVQPKPVPDWVNATIGLEKPSSGSGAAASTSVNADSSSSLGSGSTYFDNVASMMSGVADALAHAHDQGVIHRDIKPSNLLLSPDGRLSINDFGLARMLEQPGMTISGELMGSPMYMSPEQITSGRIPLDHRTDIYSLGASLYQLLTLQAPFDGQQRDQVLSQIIHKEPSLPRTINKRIPKDLETICLKAMEKDPDRRYQTADQMADDLRHFVDRHAISARRIGAIERATRWARKNKALASMACLTFIVGLSASVFVYDAWLDNRTMRREQAEEKALELAMVGDLAGAIESIESAKNYGASEDWSLVLSGQVDLFKGNSARAVEQLQAAVRQNSDNVTAHSILAHAYLADGQWDMYEQKVDELLAMPAVTPRDQLFQGHGIYFHSTERALDLMNTAIDERPDFHLGRVLRARGRIFHALDQDDRDLLGQANRDLDVASAFLKDNPLLSHARLHARLAAYKFSKRAGDVVQARSDLNEAVANVRQLEQYPSFLFGNALRLYFHSFRSELHEMELVMEDVIEHGNNGFVADAYLAYCFGAGLNQDALKLLDRMSKQDDMYVLSSRTILLSETPTNRERAEAICTKLIEKYPYEDMSHVGLFLLGNQSAAMQAAKKHAKSMNIATERSFDQDEISYKGGIISASQLLKRAGNSERRLGQAYFHIGVRQLAEGNREAALENFEKSAGTLVFYTTEVAWAGAFAERMRNDRNWPDWLPVKPANSGER